MTAPMHKHRARANKTSKDAPGGVEEHQDQAQGRDEDLAAQGALGKEERDRGQG